VLVATALVVTAACSGASGARSATATTLIARHGSAGCAHPAGARPESGQHQIVVAGMPRSYRLDVPRGRARADRPRPLLLSFHGFNGTGDQHATYSGLPARAATEGYIVASPDGANKDWLRDAHGTDAAFIDALVHQLMTTTCIDERRVYASGFSAGAAFTIIYSCGRQNLIAAIATAAVEFQLGCKAPMPILAFHGTKDPAVPFDDGAVGSSLPGIHVRGTELNMRDWAELDGCGATPSVTNVNADVTREAWTGCARRTDVVLYRLEGAGHIWPGATGASGNETVAAGEAAAIPTIDGNGLVLDFFDRHTHR
jgi:polyhydroxybutyrate depolymerase